MQINNLKIKWNKLYLKWQVVAPDKRVLEEFDKQVDAENCAKTITDFVRIGGRVQQ